MPEYTYDPKISEPVLVPESVRPENYVPCEGVAKLIAEDRTPFVNTPYGPKTA
jgi:hypothetical protein